MKFRGVSTRAEETRCASGCERHIRVPTVRRRREHGRCLETTPAGQLSVLRREARVRESALLPGRSSRRQLSCIRRRYALFRRFCRCAMQGIVVFCADWREDAYCMRVSEYSGDGVCLPRTVYAYFRNYVFGQPVGCHFPYREWYADARIPAARTPADTAQRHQRGVEQFF